MSNILFYQRLLLWLNGGTITSDKGLFSSSPKMIFIKLNNLWIVLLWFFKILLTSFNHCYFLTIDGLTVNSYLELRIRTFSLLSYSSCFWINLSSSLNLSWEFFFDITVTYLWILIFSIVFDLWFFRSVYYPSLIPVDWF